MFLQMLMYGRPETCAAPPTWQAKSRRLRGEHEPPISGVTLTPRAVARIHSRQRSSCIRFRRRSLTIHLCYLYFATKYQDTAISCLAYNSSQDHYQSLTRLLSQTLPLSSVFRSASALYNRTYPLVLKETSLPSIVLPRQHGATN